MRRRGRFSLNPKYIFIGTAIVCCGLMFVSFRYKGVVTPAKNAVLAVLSPMQKGINSIGTSISDKLDQMENMSELLAENKKLKEELSAISFENKILLQDKYELDGLRSLYELDQKYPDYPKVAARVIRKDSNNWYSQFTIDKGAEDGLSVDMNVMAGNGLVGIITQVGKNYSIVRAIIDDKSSVSGMFLKTSDNCIVDGDLKLMDDGHIRVSEIKKDAKVAEGYEVVTSHISPKYLQGILIGYVSDIKTDASNMTKSAYLTPAVDFSKLQEVLIITELKEQLEDLDTKTDTNKKK